MAAPAAVIDGAFRRELRESLLGAFASLSEFRVFLSEELDWELSAILADVLRADNPGPAAEVNPTPPELTGAVFDVIRWARDRGRLPDFVAAAARAKPHSPRLRALADRLRGRGKPETIVQPGGFLETPNWARMVLELGKRVCCIEPQPPPKMDDYGTGFLVGPDLVMTNYHVADKLRGKPTRGASAVVFRFDYVFGPDGRSVRKGRVYSLADDWLVFSSPAHKLDYALVRLNGRPGCDPVGGKRLRGYLEPAAHEFVENENIIIFQHPSGRPLSHKIGNVTRAVDGDWVRYSVNTEGGSSGSPCTTEDLRVVAIHHYGFPHYNRGVRFSAILRHLKANRSRLRARGVTGLLGLGA
jgi:V8-like Glu-specific endopeptidase